MKGINILYDAKGRKQQIQIDVTLLQKNPEAVEEIMDVIICEGRRNEPAISLADLKKKLDKAAGK